MVEVPIEDERVLFVEGAQIVGEVVTIYAAVASTYETTKVMSYHLTRHDAVLGASGVGYSKKDGDVRSMLALKLADGRYALTHEIVQITEDPEAEAKLRQQAQNKLSPSELAALMGKSGK
jgi:hypothetical protein